MRLVSVTSNKTTFKSVLFKDGLNLVLADRTIASSVTDSRNGVGKTTLLQIVDFCLGGRVSPGDSLDKLIGSDWEFHLELIVRKLRLTASRGLDNSSEIVLTGDYQLMGLPVTDGSDELTMGPGQWADWLGSQSFGLKDRSSRQANEPTFRGLVRHFLRFRRDAYVSEFSTFSGQPSAQVQVENAFLLSLNWRYAVDWQRLKDRQKQLNALSKADLEQLGSDLAEMQARRARESRQIDRLDRDISAFRVLPQYREVEERANSLSSQMRRISNEYLVAAKEIELYREQMMESTETAQAGIEDLFREVGIQFPDGVERSLTEVRQFHSAVIANRAKYLSSEVSRLEVRQSERQAQLRVLEHDRQDAMRLLQSHGALEEYSSMQKRAGALAASIAELSARIEQAQEVRRGKSALKASLLELAERAERDLDERSSVYAGVQSRFSEVFEILYKEEASLLIEIGDSGYKFGTFLPKAGSTGIGKVGIFAYDISLAETWCSNDVASKGCEFLAHDSVIFDGVDERQTAGAIAIAAESAGFFKYQYLLTANSDDLTNAEFERVGVNIDENVILRLTDATEDGGILGVRV